MLLALLVMVPCAFCTFYLHDCFFKSKYINNNEENTNEKILRQIDIASYMFTMFIKFKQILPRAWKHWASLVCSQRQESFPLIILIVIASHFHGGPPPTAFSLISCIGLFKWNRLGNCILYCFWDGDKIARLPLVFHICMKPQIGYQF